MPEAKAICEKKPKSAEAIKATWDAARVVLLEGHQAAQAQIETAQQMAPEALLFKIEDRLARLESTFMQLSDAILTIEKGKEEALGRTLYSAARKQREAPWTTTDPRISEETVAEQKDAEEGTVKELAPQGDVRATSEPALAHKEGPEEAGRYWRNTFPVEQLLTRILP